VADLENKERLRDDLHPGADCRADEPKPEKAKIPVAQDPKWPARGGFWGTIDVLHRRALGPSGILEGVDRSGEPALGARTPPGCKNGFYREETP
jgi:hypothetical protein